MKAGRKFVWMAAGALAIALGIGWMASRQAIPSSDGGKIVQAQEGADRPSTAIAGNQPARLTAGVDASPGVAAIPDATGKRNATPTMEAPWMQFAGAEVIESRDSKPDAAGLVERVRVVKTAMKYPYVRIVEKVQAANPSGEPVSFTAAVADHMLVRVQDGLTEEKVATIASQHGFSVLKKMLAPDTYLVAFGNVSIDALPAAMESFNQEVNAVQYSEPDVLIFASATTPNDPAFTQLWGMHQSTDKDIDAPEAWDLGQGSSNVVVAVIDTGIDYSHEDLAANLWRNPGEIAGNGIDDDGNGFIDDVYGWDFCNDDSDPYDDNAHGTHCAGTIGAVGNNGVGVAGVNWRVKLMAVKCMNSGGSGFISDAVDAVYYATQRGVRLTSNSWGYYGWLQSLKDAIDDAGASNILFVAAAGNEANNCDDNPSYPSSFVSANIISVAGTDADDDLAWFSNFGKTTVDLGAPGVAIYSTVPTAQGKYASFSGTSMATPHVAGACALVAAYSPLLTAAQIKQRILDNTDRSPTLSGKTVTGGRLNLYKSLSGAVPLEPPGAPSALGAVPAAHLVELSWMDNATNETGFALERRSGSSGFTVLASVAANTTNRTDTNVMGGVTYTYRIKAHNAAGDSAYSSEASATVPGAADAWDPGDDTVPGGTVLDPITTTEASHGPHTLSGTDLADWYQVVLQVDGLYNFNAIGGSGDTYAELFRDAAGTQRVAADDDGGGGLMFMVEYVADSNATYYLRVRTEPAAGNAAYNLKYSMTGVSNQVPTVELTSPGSNAVYQAPASISIAATASDPDGSIAEVKFYNGATLLSTDTSSPYDYDWKNVAAGSYPLKAVATDNGGTSVTSTPVTVVVNAQPAVSLISPSNGATFVEGALISIQAAASDPDGTIGQVAFFDGITLLGTDDASPFSYAWTNAAPGSHSLTAQAVDNRSGVSTSAVVTLTVVEPQPVLTVAPTNFNLQVMAGQNASSGSFTVANSGSGTMNYEITESIGWLSVSPTNGSSTGAANTHAVVYSTAGLAAGTYSGTLTVTSAGATGSPKNIAVNLLVSSNSLNVGLVGYYPFNGNANDESGNGNHGIVNGANLTNDLLGHANAAYSFPGGTNRINCGDPADNSFDLTGDATLMGWMSFATPFATSPYNPGYFAPLVGKDIGSGQYNKWFFSAYRTGLTFHVNGSAYYTGNWAYSDPFTFELNRFYHVAVVKTGNSYTFYADGQQKGTKVLSIPVMDVAAPLIIGYAEPSYVHQGVIDEVRIYNRALSSNEIWQVYGGGSASISGTVSYSGSQTGQIVVVSGSYTNRIAAPGAYSLSNLPTPRTYSISAFRDSNGNHQRDYSEPYGEYAGNPLVLTNNLAGVNLTLNDQNPVDAGLVAYYPFNGNANDASGYGNNGVASNVTPVSNHLGVSNSAYRFNGTNAQVLVSDNPALRSLGSNYTFNVWASFASIPTHDVGIMIKSPLGGSQVKWLFWQHVQASPLGIGLVLRRTAGGAAQYWGYTNSYLTNEWHMLTFSASGTNCFIAVDGVVKSVQSGNMALPSTTGLALSIGGPEPSGIQWFHGSLDEIRIYNRALSSNEVWHLYGGGGSAAISGTISYGGSLTGQIVVVAGNTTNQIAAPGAYSISNLPTPGSYSVSAFRDSNGNHQHDLSEPYGEYVGNPVNLANNMAGVDITLTDQNSLDVGLLAYYPFNGNANDESGHGRTGTINGATWVAAGASGGAYRFASKTQTITATDAGLPSGDAPRSMAAWMKLDVDYTDGVTWMVSYGTPGTSRKYSMLGFEWRGDQDRLMFSPGGTVLLSDRKIPTTGTWVHVVYTYGGNGGAHHLYVDGLLSDGSNGLGSSPFNTELSGMLLLGGYADSAGPDGGYLDEVRIYNRALSSDEVWQLYGGSATGSISGTIQYGGDPTGPIVVRAGINNATLTGPGAYTISNLPAGSYAVSAFCDVNSNGVLNDYEPVGTFTNNPVVVQAGPVAGVNVAIGDADSDGDGLSDAYEVGYGRYQIVQEKYTWAGAKTNSMSRGGHLATITSATEWDVIQQICGVNLNGLDLWLGGTDQLQEGVWKWVTGESWSYTRWYPGEPNNNENEDFLEINHSTNSLGSWNDYRDISNDPLGYLLEIGYYTDPHNADTDGDGLNDGQEVNVRLTDPTNPDTDGDGLNDGAEIAAGTDPLDPDSDDDGLNDFYEVVTRPCLDPTDPDTDDDGILDGAEVAAGSDPCSAGSGVFSIAGNITYGGNRTGAVYISATTANSVTQGPAPY